MWRCKDREREDPIRVAADQYLITWCSFGRFKIRERKLGNGDGLKEDRRMRRNGNKGGMKWKPDNVYWIQFLEQNAI